MDGTASPTEPVWTREEFIRRYQIYHDATPALAEQFGGAAFDTYQTTRELPFFVKVVRMPGPA